MEKNDILSGFIVLDRQSVDELDAVLWQMEHQKSGARLVWLERAEENKPSASLSKPSLGTTQAYFISWNTRSCAAQNVTR